MTPPFGFLKTRARPNQTLIIAVDFDGTVVEHEYPAIGGLKPGAKEALIELKKAGHKIIIWTCRIGKEEQEVRQFLKEQEIPFDTVNTPIAGADLGTRKIYADIYIDDKGLRFENNWEVIRKLVLGR